MLQDEILSDFWHQSFRLLFHAKLLLSPDALDLFEPLLIDYFDFIILNRLFHKGVLKVSITKIEHVIPKYWLGAFFTTFRAPFVLRLFPECQLLRWSERFLELLLVEM